MGICSCRSNKNLLITSEVSVPPLDDNPKDETVNNSTQNKSQIEINVVQDKPPLLQIEEKFLKKNMVKFLPNNDKSLTSQLEKINKAIIAKCKAKSQEANSKNDKIFQQLSETNDDGLPYVINQRVLKKEEEETLEKYITNHFMFVGLENDIIQSIVQSIYLFQIDPNVTLFKEGEKGQFFFIVKNGKLELKTRGKKKTIAVGDSFSESCLIEKNPVRLYSVTTKSQVEIYAMSFELCEMVLHAHNRDNLIEEIEVERKKYQNETLDFYLLKVLDKSLKKSIWSLCRFFSFNENGLLLISNQNQKSGGKKATRLIPYFSNPKNVIFPFEGELTEKFNLVDMERKISKGSAAGMVYTLLNMYEKNEFVVRVSQARCDCIVMSENVFLEYIGVDYSYQILLKLFCDRIKSSELITAMIPDNENRKSHFEQLYKSFENKDYKGLDIVIPRSTYDNKKLVLTLVNDLINQKGNQIALTQGNISKDDIINSAEDLSSDLLAKKPFVITLECSWRNIKKVIKSFPENKHLFDAYEHLSKISILRHFSEINIFKLAKRVRKEKFKKGDYLLQNGAVNEKFFLLSRGRVKMRCPKTDKTLRVFDEGNCFGELSLLEAAPNTFNVVASESTVCYTMTRDDFLNLISDQKANEYLKEKMLMEDSDIALQNLYYISYLGRGRFGNVCLVHNTIAFYAAKAISKIAAEKQKTGVRNLLNEKKTMIAVDHPFVVKLVKTLKKEGWCFLLEEFICGKNFADYLDSRKIKKNLEETKFYGAILLEIISYLNKRHIIHRDIKPSNIMMDYNGYLKLIDFGTARKLKGKSQTVIGTPNFIAPEILLGKGYSFSCDYWSIGVCLFYIYFGILPFGHKAIELMEIYKEIVEKDPEFPKDSPLEIKQLINGLLVKKESQRITSMEMVQKQKLYKDFDWDDLIKYKIKPYYIPHRDPRDNPENLQITNSPFTTFMESEKFETIQMQTLKIGNSKEINRANSFIKAQWFDDF